jgi:hypothetical protein
MRTETSTRRTERQRWVTAPSIFVRPEFVRRAGDMTSYPFTRDLAMYEVVSAAIGKMKVIRDVRMQPQEVNPVAGRSTVGTMEVDLGNVGGDVLKQLADPAKPLRLAVRGTATIRNASHIRAFPCAKTLYGSTWTQSGLASFTAASVNDDITEGAIAFDADAAAADSWLKLDLGVGVTAAFVSVAVYSGFGGTVIGSLSLMPFRGSLGLQGRNASIGATNTLTPQTGALALTGEQAVSVGHNAWWWIQYSDDNATWTTISKGWAGDGGFGTGGRRVDTLNFPYSGAHRYWRLLKQNGAQAGPDYFEVQFSTQQLGRNTIVQVTDSTGYPDTGHVTIDSEDIFYADKDDMLGVFGDATYHTVTRAARDTLIGDHGADVLVRNGEQIRRGTRLTPYLGYQPSAEAEFMAYTKLEVQSYASRDFGLTWTLRCSDIQRFVKRKIFELATETNPATLTGHPITLLLQVWMSTGIGNNGPYDVLPRENGAAVPQALIAIDAWESLRSVVSSQFQELGVTDLQFAFMEIEPQDSKEWGETQIMRPLMILPDVNQLGQLTGRLIAQPSFSHGAYWSGAFKAA